ncbi:transposable element Tcb2 transposase [Trichonephila clavipes]|nr:transposable element Tcb2 transposase [Trichonephila clavipes]
MTAQRYVHDILQPLVLRLMQHSSQEPFFNKTMLGLTREGYHKTVSTLLPHNCVRSWKPRSERFNPAFAVEQHTALKSGVTVWVVIAYDAQLPLILIHGAMAAQRYVHDILHFHEFSPMTGLFGAIFQQDKPRSHTTRMSQVCLCHITILLWPT